MQIGAVILCGGKSIRMGCDKATLPFGTELMLQRVVRLIGDVVPSRQIAIVAAPGQYLPQLPNQIRVSYDLHAGRGPLEGMSAGLNVLLDQVDAAFVTACDTPFLVPSFVTRMFELLEHYDVAVPCESKRLHPLAAVYRPKVLNSIQQLLQGNQLRVQSLFDKVKTRFVDVENLQVVDPQLQTLMNLNSPDDYQAALKIAGLATP